MSSKAFPPWAVAATGLLLVLGSIGTLKVLRLDRSPPPETSQEELTFQSGRWLWVRDSQPFTGIMVDHYESGALKSRSAVSNGLLEGVSEGWFTNGHCQVQEHFRNNVSHGLRTKWHANGCKMSEVLIADGKLEGVFRRWDQEGCLLEEIQMHDGLGNGVSRAYHPDGSLRAQARLEHGRLLEQHFWRPGERRP